MPTERSAATSRDDQLELVPKCPNCHGTGQTRFGPCAYCKGTGHSRPSSQISGPLPGASFADIFKGAA